MLTLLATRASSAKILQFIRGGAVQVDRFEGFDKQNDFRVVGRFDFSAVSIMATMSATDQSLSVVPAAIVGLKRSVL